MEGPHGTGGGKQQLHCGARGPQSRRAAWRWGCLACPWATPCPGPHEAAPTRSPLPPCLIAQPTQRFPSPLVQSTAALLFNPPTAARDSQVNVGLVPHNDLAATLGAVHHDGQQVALGPGGAEQGRLHPEQLRSVAGDSHQHREQHPTPQPRNPASPQAHKPAHKAVSGQLDSESEGLGECCPSPSPLSKVPTSAAPARWDHLQRRRLHTLPQPWLPSSQPWAGSRCHCASQPQALARPTCELG